MRTHGVHYCVQCRYGADTPLGPWLIKKGADDKVIFPFSYFIFINSSCCGMFVLSQPS